MNNYFAIVLETITIITAIIWIMEKLKFISYTNKKKKLIKNISSIFPTLLTVFIIRSFIYEPFQIPSTSMLPNLITGDFIVVEKFSYGLKDPITQKTLIHFKYPKRGDVIVFKYPHNTKLYFIKRIIGLPGDIIFYNNLNKTIKIYKNQKNIKINYFTKQKQKNQKIIKEIIENNKHCILINKMTQEEKFITSKFKKSIELWTIPKNNYFVLGDNRDNSYDSRFWGFVPSRNIIGKAKFIWINITKNQNKWPIRIKLNRIGKIQ